MQTQRLTITLVCDTSLSAAQLSEQVQACFGAIETTANAGTTQLVNIDIKASVSNGAAPCKAQYGTVFPHGTSAIEVELDENGEISDAWMSDVDCALCPVSHIRDFTQMLQVYQAGGKSPLFTDYDEEPAEIVYLATSPSWEGAKLITNIDLLTETLADPSVTSFVRLTLETGCL